MYHADSEKTVTDSTIDDFQELVEFFINNLFNVHCSQLVPVTYSLIPNQESSTETLDEEEPRIPINRIRKKINVIIIAVAESQSENYDAILEVLKRRGFKGKISKSVLSAYMNSIFKHMFYFDTYWKLTQDEGMNRYKKLKKEFGIKEDD